MELALIIAGTLIAITAVVVTGVLSLALSRQASEAERQVRSLLVARVTTVENRLMSHQWQDFAQLQMVPDETAKTAWVEERSQRPPESVGLTEDEVRSAFATMSGADLEGDEWTGPTVG